MPESLKTAKELPMGAVAADRAGATEAKQIVSVVNGNRFPLNTIVFLLMFQFSVEAVACKGSTGEMAAVPITSVEAFESQTCWQLK